jgi:hypothetical protein
MPAAKAPETAPESPPVEVLASPYVPAEDLSIQKAISAVIRELPGIGKDSRMTQGAGYNYRGIDDVLPVLRPFLAKYGIVVTPVVEKRLTEERNTKAGGLAFVTHLRVRFTFHGPTGDSIDAVTWGEAADSGDKSTNKAMTAAFKYALFQTFVISDPAADPDTYASVESTGSRPTGRNRRPAPIAAEPDDSPITRTAFNPDAPPKPPALADIEDRRDVADRLKALPEANQREVANRLAEHGCPPASKQDEHQVLFARALIQSEAGKATKAGYDYASAYQAIRTERLGAQAPETPPAPTGTPANAPEASGSTETPGTPPEAPTAPPGNLQYADGEEPF